MLQRFETVEIPVVDSPDQARELLHEFAMTDLPALAIRNTSSNTVQDAVAEISADLPASMETDPQTVEFWFGNAAGLSHIGLHHDHDLPVQGETEIPVTYHVTQSGFAVASLFAVGPQYMERAWNVKLAAKNALRDEMERDFADGMVDTDLVLPVRHQVQLTPGMHLIFKSGAPYWHYIEDEPGTGRLSLAVDSRMAITPGMGQQYGETGRRPLADDWDEPFPSLRVS